MDLVTVRLDPELLRVFQALVSAGHAEAQRRSDRGLCVEGFILAQTIRQISADGRLVLRRSEYRILAELLQLGKAARPASAEGHPPADEMLVRRIEAPHSHRHGPPLAERGGFRPQARASAAPLKRATHRLASKEMLDRNGAG